MLNKISTYLSNTKKRIFDQFSQKNLHSSSKGLCCIGVTSKEFTLVYAREVAGKMTIELCESQPYTDTSSLISSLATIVKNNQLKNVPCSLMLHPEDYQLLVTDALPVTESEFQSAIRWKIKDLIHFPLDDVVIDSFEMPKMKIGKNKIMVVAAQASKLNSLNKQIEECKLDLKYIDIPELALRNITVLYEKENNSTLLIYVQENTIQLLITFQEQMYVSRQLKFSLNEDDAGGISPGIERLSSEILRSFDYYQSLWDQPVPSRFIFSSTKTIKPESIELLSQKLKSPIEVIDLDKNDRLVCKPQLALDLQAKYLPIIGGVVRESMKHATAD